VQHVHGGNALGDAHGEVEAGVGRFQNRVRGARGRHEDHRRIRARLLDRLADRVEDGKPQDDLSALARGDTGHHLGSILDRELGVELPHPTEPLDQELGVPVTEDRHR
jgi:hypothetical protein